MVIRKREQVLRVVNYLENEIIPHFMKKKNEISKDTYFADRDSRNILDHDINIIVLGVADICEGILRINKLQVPDHFKLRILACHEFIGEIVFAIAPLTKNRNETVHEYLKINWDNIVTVWNSLDNVKKFLSSVNTYLHSRPLGPDGHEGDNFSKPGK